MPAMPEPISRCPIFDRLDIESSKLTNLKMALVHCNNEEDFVAIGVKAGVINPAKYWCVGGETYSEPEYIYQLWLDKGNNGWWFACMHPKKYKHDLGKMIHDGLNDALHKAIEYMESHEGETCPIKGYWICVDEGCSVKVKRLKIGKQAFVALRIKTPPPPEGIDAVEGACT